MAPTKKCIVCIYGVSVLTSDREPNSSSLVLHCSSWDSLSDEDTRRHAIRQRSASTSLRPDLVKKTAAVASAPSIGSRDVAQQFLDQHAAYDARISHRERNFKVFELTVPGIQVDVSVYKVVQKGQEIHEPGECLFVSKNDPKRRIVFKKVDASQFGTSIKFEDTQLQALLHDDCDPETHTRVWYMGRVDPMRHSEQELSNLSEFYQKLNWVPFAAPGVGGRASLDSHEILWRVNPQLKPWTLYEFTVESRDQIISKATIAAASLRSLFNSPVPNTHLAHEVFPVEYVIVRVKSGDKCSVSFASNSNLRSAVVKWGFQETSLKETLARIEKHRLADTSSFQLLLFERCDLDETLNNGKTDESVALMEQHNTSVYKLCFGRAGLMACFPHLTRSDVNSMGMNYSTMAAHYVPSKAAGLVGEQPNDASRVGYMIAVANFCRLTGAPFHVASSHLAVKGANLQVAASMLTREFLWADILTLPWPKTTSPARTENNYKGADVMPVRVGFYTILNKQAQPSTLAEVDFTSAYPSVVCEHGLCLRLPKERLVALKDTFDQDKIWKKVEHNIADFAQMFPLVGTESIKAPESPTTNAKKTASGAAAAAAPRTPEMIERARQDAIRTRIKKRKEMNEHQDRYNAVDNPMIQLRALPVSHVFATLIQSRKQKNISPTMLQVLKLAANALYGALGSPYFRYYCREFAAAITAVCRRNIRIFRYLLPRVFEELHAEMYRQEKERSKSELDEPGFSPLQCHLLASPTDAILFNLLGVAYRDVQIEWLCDELTRSLGFKWIHFGKPKMLKAVAIFATNNALLYPASASRFLESHAVGTAVQQKHTPKIAKQWLLDLYTLCFEYPPNQDSIRAFIDKVVADPPADTKEPEEVKFARIWFKEHLTKFSEYTARLLAYCAPNLTSGTNILEMLQSEEIRSNQQHIHYMEQQQKEQQTLLVDDDKESSSALIERSPKRLKIETTVSSDGPFKAGPKIFQKWWAANNLEEYLGLEAPK